jgi:hypothetical protein
MGRAASESLRLNKADFTFAGKDQVLPRLGDSRIPVVRHSAAIYSLPVNDVDAAPSDSLLPNDPVAPRAAVRYTPGTTPRIGFAEFVRWSHETLQNIGLSLAKRNDGSLKSNTMPKSRSASSPSRKSTLASKPSHLEIPNFSLYRDLCLHQQSPHDADKIRQLSDEFRTLRKNKSLSRSQTAELLQCSVEQIGVLENGFGNLETAQSLIFRLRRLQE